LCAQALKLLTDVDNPAVECVVLAAAASCHAQATGRDIDETEVVAAISAADRAGGTYWPIMTRCFLSYSAPLPLAESLCTQALHLAEQGGLVHFGAVVRAELAVITQFRGDGHAALDAFRQLGLPVEAHNWSYYALAEGEYGTLAVGIHLAEHLLVELARRPHDPAHTAALHTVLAHLHRLTGDLERCEDALERAGRAVFQLGGFVWGLATVTRAALLRLRGQAQAAAQVIEPACALIGLRRRSDMPMRVVEELAAIASSIGRTHDAADLLATAEEARRIEHKPLSPALERELHGLYAKVDVQQGRPVNDALMTSLVRSMAV
jgi:hypothetical protein